MAHSVVLLPRNIYNMNEEAYLDRSLDAGFCDEEMYLNEALLYWLTAISWDALSWSKPRISQSQRRLNWLSTQGPCVRCGGFNNLEVDHIESRHKTNSPQIKWGWPILRLTVELQKCQVLCRDCHYQKSAEEFGWAEERGLHGYTRYKSGCRCDICRKSVAERELKRYHRKRRRLGFAPRKYKPKN